MILLFKEEDIVNGTFQYLFQSHRLYMSVVYIYSCLSSQIVKLEHHTGDQIETYEGVELRFLDDKPLDLLTCNTSHSFEMKLPVCLDEEITIILVWVLLQLHQYFELVTISKSVVVGCALTCC